MLNSPYNKSFALILNVAGRMHKRNPNTNSLWKDNFIYLFYLSVEAR